MSLSLLYRVPWESSAAAVVQFAAVEAAADWPRAAAPVKSAASANVERVCLVGWDGVRVYRGLLWGATGLAGKARHEGVTTLPLNDVRGRFPDHWQAIS